MYHDGHNPTFWCSIKVLYYNINQYWDALNAYSHSICSTINLYISEVVHISTLLLCKQVAKVDMVLTFTICETYRATLLKLLYNYVSVLSRLLWLWLSQSIYTGCQLIRPMDQLCWCRVQCVHHWCMKFNLTLIWYCLILCYLLDHISYMMESGPPFDWTLFLEEGTVCAS